MIQRVGNCLGKVALYRDLASITVSDIKSECITNHVSRNNIRINDTGITGTTNFDVFPVHSIHCKDEFRMLQAINFVHKY